MWSDIMELSYQFEGKLVQLVKTPFNKSVHGKKGFNV